MSHTSCLQRICVGIRANEYTIGSLCCDTAEEAKTLIPSLTDKITDDDLQELLDEITKLMGYQS